MLSTRLIYLTQRSYFIDPEFILMKQTWETEDMRPIQMSLCERPLLLVHEVSQTKWITPPECSISYL